MSTIGERARYAAEAVRAELKRLCINNVHIRDLQMKEAIMSVVYGAPVEHAIKEGKRAVREIAARWKPMNCVQIVKECGKEHLPPRRAVIPAPLPRDRKPVQLSRAA